MSAAAAAVLGGMPDPAGLHVHEDGGRVAVMARNRVLSCYRAADAGMRNMTVVMLTQLGFTDKDLAAVLLRWSILDTGGVAASGTSSV